MCRNLQEDMYDMYTMSRIIFTLANVEYVSHDHLQTMTEPSAAVERRELAEGLNTTLHTHSS